MVEHKNKEIVVLSRAYISRRRQSVSKEDGVSVGMFIPHHTIKSRHTVVCRAAQEAGAPHREYIDRKNENVIFTPLYLGDHLSDWNQICYTVARQPRESTFQI